MPSESQAPPTPSINRHWPPGPHLLSTPGTILAIDYSTIPACLGLIGLCSSWPLPAPSTSTSAIGVGLHHLHTRYQGRGPFCVQASRPQAARSSRGFLPQLPTYRAVRLSCPSLQLWWWCCKARGQAWLLTDHRTRDRLPKQAPAHPPQGFPLSPCAPSDLHHTSKPTHQQTWLPGFSAGHSSPHPLQHKQTSVSTRLTRPLLQPHRCSLRYSTSLLQQNFIANQPIPPSSATCHPVIKQHQHPARPNPRPPCACAPPEALLALTRPDPAPFPPPPHPPLTTS